MTNDDQYIDDYDSNQSDDYSEGEYSYDEYDSPEGGGGSNDLKKKVAIVGTLMALLFVFYFVFIGGDNKTSKNQQKKVTKAVQVEEDVEIFEEDEIIPEPLTIIDQPDENIDDFDVSLPEIDDLFIDDIVPTFNPPSEPDPEPSFTDLAQPKEPELPRAQPRRVVITPPKPKEPQPPTVVKLPDTQPKLVDNTQAELEAQKRARAKRRRSVMLINGGGSPQKAVATEFHGIVSNQSGVERTPLEEIKATYIGRTDLIIAQGKIIDAVLETAINTDLKGLIRAVVSRDIYAESGKRILVPKGSRLIGSYSAPNFGGSRVMITWNRIIRPDGIDVVMSAPGTDSLGRAGLTGFVDNKFFDIITNAFLLSAITVGSALLVDSVNETGNATNTVTQNVDGSSSATQTVNATDGAVLDALDSFTNASSQVVQSTLDINPTIIVQQGEKIKVFVNQDIHFPDNVTLINN